MVPGSQAHDNSDRHTAPGSAGLQGIYRTISRIGNSNALLPQRGWEYIPWSRPERARRMTTGLTSGRAALRIHGHARPRHGLGGGAHVGRGGRVLQSVPGQQVPRGAVPGQTAVDWRTLTLQLFVTSPMTIPLHLHHQFKIELDTLFDSYEDS